MPITEKSVRHDASILTRLFMGVVPFNEPGPYAVPPGPFNPNPPAAAAGNNSSLPAALLLSMARRAKGLHEESIYEPYERYPIEEDLKQMYRRHQEEIAEEPADR